MMKKLVQEIKLRTQKMLIAIFVLSLFLPSLLSQESTTEKCKAEFDGQCLRRVNCTVEEKVVLEKSELFVAYRGQEQEEEVIAQCDWQSGDFRCDPVDGYTCELLPPRYFTVSVNQGAHCLSSGEFEVDAANQQPIRCDISKYRHTVSDLNSPVSTTTVKDTVNEAKDNTIVAGVVGGVIGCLATVIVGILVWIKMCRKPRQGPEGNNTTSDSVGKTPQENTTFLNESEKNDHRKWTCVEKLRQMWFPGASASGTSAV